MEQADTVWHCLLKYERDANAQLEVCVCGGESVEGRVGGRGGEGCTFAVF